MFPSDTPVANHRILARKPGLTLLLVVLFSTCFPFVQGVQPASPTSLDSFLNEHLPRIEGQVIGRAEPGYHVDVETTFPPVTVRIYRKSVVRREGTRRVVTRPIGSGRLRSVRRGLAILRVKDDLRDRVRPGDRVVWRVDPLYVRNDSAQSNQSLRSQLLNHPRVRDVRFLDPDSTAPEGSILLEISPDRFRLQRVGEWGTLGTAYRTHEDRSRLQPSTERTAGFQVHERHRFKRVINQFEWITWPGNPRISLLVLGGNHVLGVGRRGAERLRNLAWNDISGRVYDLSALPALAGGKPILRLLLVLKQNGRLQSRLYEYDLRSRGLTHQWTANHVWIRRSGDQFYGTQIGLNTLFKQGTRPVQLFTDSWSWVPNSYRRQVDVGPPGYDVVGNRWFSLTRDGHLTLLRGNRRRGQTPATFGPSPLRLSPRGVDSARNLQPTIAAWRHDGTYRVAVARNETGGVDWLEGLRSYTSTRIRVLEWTSRRFRTVWESNRMTGYTSAIRQSGDRIWFSVVNPETSSTRLYKLSTGGNRPAR